jgi:CRISPR/Cas system endoribonuclease Cas6 (RAMP superfamily)
MRTASIAQGVSPHDTPIRSKLSLFTVHPNPFNSATLIEFSLPSTRRVSLRSYDVLGREVAVMMNEIQTAGRHRLTFDASGLPSGVYLCRLEAGGMAQTRKIVLIR